MRNPIRRNRAHTDPQSAVQPVRQEQRRLAARVTALEAAVEENRRLNQRLADVVDVVTEVLVPAIDRDDERIRAALADLGKALDEG